MVVFGATGLSEIHRSWGIRVSNTGSCVSSFDKVVKPEMCQSQVNSQKTGEKGPFFSMFLFFFKNCKAYTFFAGFPASGHLVRSIIRYGAYLGTPN